MFYFLAFGLSFALSVAATLVVKKIALRIGALDRPMAARKIHARPIPLFGGMAIFFAVTLTLGFLAWLSPSFRDTPLEFLLAIVGGGLLLIIGGALDDLFDLPPLIQFVFPLAATLLVIASGIHISAVTALQGNVPLHLSTGFGISLSLIWLLGMMYTTKFLDGLDGLVSGIGVIAAMIIFIVSLFWDTTYSGTGFMALAVAGAALGFLLYNFYPAKIFLGEGGSLFLGYILGVLSILSGSKIATAFLILALPIIDTFWVIIRRLAHKQSPAHADQKHFHFLLIKSGLSQPQAVVLLYVIALSLGLLSLFLNTVGKIIALVIAAVIISIAINTLYQRTHQ